MLFAYKCIKVGFFIVVIHNCVVIYFYQQNAIGAIETVTIITGCTRDRLTVLRTYNLPLIITLHELGYSQ